MWTLIRLLLEEQSDLGPHCLQIGFFLNHKQMTKQTTIVVTWQLCCEKVSLIIPKNAQIQIHSAHEQSLIRAFALYSYIL